MIWACDTKIGLHGKEGDGNGSTREEEERRPKRKLLNRVRGDIKEMGRNGMTELHGARWRISSNIDPHIKV